MKLALEATEDQSQGPGQDPTILDGTWRYAKEGQLQQALFNLEHQKPDNQQFREAYYSP